MVGSSVCNLTIARLCLQLEIVFTIWLRSSVEI